ncbi:putative leader peptide [Streptomyces abyssomicinicus]
MAPFLVSRRHVDLLRVAGMLCRAGRRCRAACR